MRGASALEDMLRRSGDEGLRVFVVWEPVIWSDLTPPLTGVLARVSDRRAAQFWDKERLVSDALLRVVDAGEETIVWDCAAIFPPGTRWDQELPAPAFIDCPVVAVIEEVARHLSSPAAAEVR